MKYTIFTPTYNRAHLLPALFNSLLEQSGFDFEWLIIDDGSTDDTESCIQQFIETAPFSIRYIKKQNGGKHTAFNVAIREARGEWFVCIDSDDPLLPGAIANMDELVEIVRKDNTLAGFVGICKSPQGELMGKVPGEPIVSDTIEIRDKYHMQCEPEVYKTSILKNYEFPEFSGEKFITEAILFDKLTSSYKLLYSNKPIQVKEYLSGGLTDNQLKIRIENPRGTLAYYKQRYFLSSDLMHKIKALINYSRFSLHTLMSRRKIQDHFFKVSLIVSPLGMLFYAIDIMKYKRSR